MQLETDYWNDKRDVFRTAILEAADKAMNEIAHSLHTSPTRNDVGAQDEDLPKLFEAIDRQFRTNMERLDLFEAEGL